jgi:hypothetical protein
VNGTPVSIGRLTMPVLYVGVLASFIAGVVYGYDQIIDDITALQTNAVFHVKLDEMERQINTIKLQRIHDNINRVQSALNFYDGKIRAGESLTEPNVKAYTSYKAELKQYQCELSSLNLGTIGREC